MHDLLAELETVADASATTTGAPAGDGPSGTAAATGATESTPAAAGAATGEPDPSSAGATEPAPAWSPDDPRLLDLVDTRAAELVQQQLGPIQELLRQQMFGGVDQGLAGQGGPQIPQVLVPPDPFSDNYAAEFAAYQQQRDEQLFSRLEGMFGQIAQPLHQQMEQQTVAEGQERLKDMLASDIDRNGEFPRLPGQTDSKAQSLVQPLAEMLFPEIAQRLGTGPRAAEVAMTRAAALVREVIAEAGAAALDRQNNHTATLAGARTDATAGAAGAQVVGEIRARNIDEGLHAVTSRHAALIRGE